MSAFLRRLVVFGLVAVLAYPVLIFLFGLILPGQLAGNVRYPLGAYGHMNTRMKEVQGQAPVDVLFIGSSHAYRGFDPRIWAKRGYSSFNLGSSAQTPIQSELLLKQYLPTLRPRLVVMEVHPGPFREEGVESAVDLMANRPVDAAISGMAWNMGDVMVCNTLLYAKVRQALGMDDDFNEDPVKDHDQYVNGGFVQRTKGGFVPVGKLRRESTTPSPEQWEAFQRILAYLRSQRCPVVLVEAPMTRWMYEGLYADHHVFADSMSGAGRYIDMNGQVALTDTVHFFTKGHLDQAGVEIFNEALLDTLEGRAWLPVKR